MKNWTHSPVITENVQKYELHQRRILLISDQHAQFSKDVLENMQSIQPSKGPPTLSGQHVHSLRASVTLLLSDMIWKLCICPVSADSSTLLIRMYSIVCDGRLSHVSIPRSVCSRTENKRALNMTACSARTLPASFHNPPSSLLSTLPSHTPSHALSTSHPPLLRTRPGVKEERE